MRKIKNSEKLSKILVIGSILLPALGSMPAYAEGLSVAKKQAIQATANQALEKAQRKVVDQATQGIQLTYKALSALSNDKTDEAKANLVDATKAFDGAMGKAEDFVPIAVAMDIAIGVETSEDAAALMSRAEEEIAASNPQAARDLLGPLVSEIDITETDIPVEVYKDFVNKAIVALDKQDKTEAKNFLLKAIGTAAFVTEVIPVPTLLAEKDLDEARNAVAADPDKALQLLKDAEQQIALNDILGYEHPDVFQQDYKTVRKKALSAYHREVWRSIEEKLGLIKESNAKNNMDKKAGKQIGESVANIERKTQKTK